MKALFSCLPFIFLLKSAFGFGSMGPISAAFGDSGFFCAIDASGKQQVICWGNKTNSSSPSSPSSLPISLPPMVALTGGGGFLCGILANTSQAYCFDSTGSASSDLVPSVFKSNYYSHIAAGRSHVCAIRSLYYSQSDLGTVDCWDIIRKSNSTRLTSRQSNLFYDQYISTLIFNNLVSGDGFSCGSVSDVGGLACWGPNSSKLEVPGAPESFHSLTSGIDSVCGVSEVSKKLKCWGANDSFGTLPNGIPFVSLAAGDRHFCGIREDNHGIECWGNYNSSSLIPKGSGFLAIASSDFVTCGIRESDLVLDCWFTNVSSNFNYDPPLELCSPGLCTPGSCGEGRFSFNASLLNEPDLTSLCVRTDLRICSPCGLNCSQGFFTSSPCTKNADRVCTPCSLCQNSSCWDICSLPPSSSSPHRRLQWRVLALIIGSSLAGFSFIIISFCSISHLNATKERKGKRGGDQESDASRDNHLLLFSGTQPFPGAAQVFRLSELKDATNGFKEFNELGRGSYGFVYKAVLPDGRQVAVKRANAATIIHTNSREFEMELEILCNVRHGNIVNLLGYCSEMGERILVYEYMPHGTLHDHLHGGLSPLNWNLRLRIAVQAAKGLEYLHKEVDPPIVHHDVKSSNILLDADWVARIADFGLLTHTEKDHQSGDVKDDVYNFGIVMLEILTGRKSYDRDCMPPNIVEWALPLLKQGKAAAVIDGYVALPRNVEPLLKFADIIELSLREDPSLRPDMSYLSHSLEQIVKEGLTL
ncbi:unnamed protein product [Cuscuta epithymum]|uniref:non-specific serine/threonine protein kinase n=1 Tax=Cuscuta epithymum TaxID=186058 RepID=A0AAV0CIW2_9ASTE|nr:unnamed protein product [Cuscuta epithymum]